MYIKLRDPCHISILYTGKLRHKKVTYVEQMGTEAQIWIQALDPKFASAVIQIYTVLIILKTFDIMKHS